MTLGLYHYDELTLLQLGLKVKASFFSSCLNNNNKSTANLLTQLKLRYLTCSNLCQLQRIVKKIVITLLYIFLQNRNYHMTVT